MSDDDVADVAALSVFAGGFTLEAARAVVGPDVEILVEQGLVVPAGPGRYELRQRGGGRPAPGDEVRERHLRWARAFAEQASRSFDSLEAERENFRAALAWGLARPDSEPALALAAALGRFWEVRGPVSEGRRYLDTALRLNPGAAPAVRANALNSAGLLAFRDRDYEAARAIYEESLALHWDLEDRLGATGALHALGNVAFQQRDWEEAGKLFAESLGIGRQLHEDEVVAASLTNLGALAEVRGDHTSARSLYGEALDLWRAAGDHFNAANVLANLADIATAGGDLVAARRFASEALEGRQLVGDVRGTATALKRLVTIASQQGDVEAARAFAAEYRRITGEADDERAGPGGWRWPWRRRKS